MRTNGPQMDPGGGYGCGPFGPVNPFAAYTLFGWIVEGGREEIFIIIFYLIEYLIEG